jgi:murein DD-endopeptidase MepM/ murein hydrolase activator NlpD
MKKLFISVLSISFCSYSYGARPSIESIRSKLSNQNHNLSVLAAKIKDIDSKIGKRNDAYLDKIQNIEQFEQKISQMKLALKENANIISDNYASTKMALELYLLEKDDEDESDSLHEQELYEELLLKKISKFEVAQSESNELLANINMYEQKLSGIKKTEENLYQLIMRLENDKKKLSQNYISLLEKKNSSQKILDRLKAKRRVVKKKKTKSKSSKPDFLMSLPIKNFVSVKKSQKGITFKFTETTPIVAPRGGKIAYAGELASYGNVIIVDHGKEVRSVFFGDITTKAIKGSSVNTGEILGYTQAVYGEQKSLYYEIRKKNKVQNTYSWFSPANIKKLRI